MQFKLTQSEQFGPQGPQAGDYGVTHESDVRYIDDETWYFAWFAGHEGYFLLPHYMMEFEKESV